MKNSIFLTCLFLITLVSNKTQADTGTDPKHWYLKTTDNASYLFIQEVGKGDPVVVLHGGPGMLHNYMLDISTGLEDKIRFIFYDQRGAGLSFCAAKETISMENNVQDLELLRKALGVKRLKIISHSAGTMLAMNYLEKFPDNVENIVLVGALDPKNGSSKFFTPEELMLFKNANAERTEFYETRPEIQQEIVKAGLNKDSLTAKEKYELHWLKSTAGSVFRLDKWRQVPFYYANGTAASGIQSTTNFRYNWSDMLKKHPFPITVINGEFDYIIGPKGSPIWKRVSAEEAQNVKLIVLKDAGHNCWVDQPELFKRSLQNALK